MNYTKRGQCATCGQPRWLGGKNGQCKPCAYPLGQCVQCGVTRKIWVDALCSVCYEDRQVRLALSRWESQWKTPFDYNARIMRLFLAYIRRYRLKYCHLKQAKRLGELFQSDVVAPLVSWAKIYEMARRYPLMHRIDSSKGCAWLKIGLMLQELGVLPPRREEYQHRFAELLSCFDSNIRCSVQEFLSALEKANNAPSTRLHYLQVLLNLQRWLKTPGHAFAGATLLEVSRTTLENYLQELCAMPMGQNHPRKTLACLHRFYRFMRFKRRVLLVPTQGIRTSREAMRLTVCSEQEIRKLNAFIRNPASNPESAFLLVLIVYFGLSIENLCYATISIEGSAIAVILRRRPRTRGCRYYNRPQKLLLPQSPPWLLALQKRFYQHWQSRYNRVKHTYPHPALVLSPRGNHNRPVSDEFLRKRVQEASCAATCISIPPRVLRQTCGHIHAREADASILTRLGWSPQFAFHYTWLPRTTFAQQKTPLPLE